MYRKEKTGDTGKRSPVIKEIRYSCLEAEKEKSKKRQKIRKETSVRGVEMIQKVHTSLSEIERVHEHDPANSGEL